MKIKADYANAPQWKETTIKSSLPKELKCLDEIAHNMWCHGIMKVVTCSRASMLICTRSAMLTLYCSWSV